MVHKPAGRNTAFIDSSTLFPHRGTELVIEEDIQRSCNWCLASYKLWVRDETICVDIAGTCWDHRKGLYKLISYSRDDARYFYFYDFLCVSYLSPYLICCELQLDGMDMMNSPHTWGPLGVPLGAPWGQIQADSLGCSHKIMAGWLKERSINSHGD